MGSWDVPGQCDIRAMTYVINAHLRRHATYHSWFEYNDRKEHRPAHAQRTPVIFSLSCPNRMVC